MRFPSSSLASLLILAPILACSDDPVTPPPLPATGAVRGGIALYDGLEVQLQFAWIGWGIEPLPGPRLDAVGFRVVNGADGPRRFDPRALRIETADGSWWPRIVAGTEPELRPMTLGTAEDVFGWTVFRVPIGADPVAVVWTPAPGVALRIPLPDPIK